jgi:hypothetical protein
VRETGYLQQLLTKDNPSEAVNKLRQDETEVIGNESECK